MSNDREKVLWEGSPSQMLNINIFMFCFFFCWLVVPIFYALWKYLEVRYTRYYLTSERLKISQGVLNRVTDELELYRVKDTRLSEPLFLRLCSLGDILLASSDRSHPLLMLRAIKNAETVRQQIRGLVEAQRRIKGVREID